MLDLDPDPAADQRADQLRHGFDLGADVEDLGFQRLPAGERQQLAGQLGGPFHRLRNRVDVAAAALFRQIAAAQEIGRGADDGQKIVEIMRHAAGELPDRFHLLRLAQRFLAAAAFGDVDGLRHRADHGAMLIAQRPHREVEIAIADRKTQHHLGLDFFSLHDGHEGVEYDFAHALRAAEPRRLPERLADHVGSVRADAGQCGLVGIEHVAVQIEQHLILVAGLEDRAHLRFAGFQLRRPLGDPQLQRLVQPAEFVLGLLGRGDVVGDADEADMLAGRVPARLRFRAQPAPFAVGVPVARLQHERLERGFAGDLLLQDARQIVRMQRLAPVEHDGLFEGQAEKVEIGLVGEGARAVELGHPDRYRRAVGDQPKALLAFAQGVLRQHLIGDVEIGADQALRAAVAVALDLGNDTDPSDLAVTRPDDAVFGRIVLARAPEHAEQMFDRALAIVGVDSADPIVVGLVDGIRRQPVNEQIFGGAAVPDAVAEIDFEAADAGHALDSCQLGLAFLQSAVGPVALVRDLFQMLP